MNMYKDKSLKVQAGVLIVALMALFLVVYWVYMRTCVIYQMPATSGKEDMLCRCMQGGVCMCTEQYGACMCAGKKYEG